MHVGGHLFQAAVDFDRVEFESEKQLSLESDYRPLWFEINLPWGGNILAHVRHVPSVFGLWKLDRLNC